MLLQSISPHETSDAHILNLVHQLYNLEQGYIPTTAYLHRAKHLADQLAIAGRPITLSEFNIFAFKGLRPDFKDLVITLAARPAPLSFAELHSLLLSHEFIHSEQFYSLSLPHASHITVNKNCDEVSNTSELCQWCSNLGHTAKSCSLLEQHHPDLSKSKMYRSPGFTGKMDKHNSKPQPVEDNHANSKAKDDNSAISRDDFPEDFVFGTATSSYQFEGAAAQGGRGIGVWDIFTTETPERILDGTNGNVAVDMYNRYKDDIQMVKKMGFTACRISISWPRILPGGRCSAGINREGINFYNDLINTMLAHDIEPYVTLFHWDLPYCLEQEYDGFLSKQIVNDFVEFVELCFWEFGDRVKHWVSLNEPWSYCISGYITGVFPPGKSAAPSHKIGNNLTTYRAIHDPNLTMPTNHTHFKSKSTSDPAKDPYTVARNLLLAHSAAVHSYRTKFQEYQEGKIGMVVCCQWYEPFDENSDKDVAASKRAMDFMLGWFLEPVLTGRYPETMVDFVPPENLAQFSEEESEMLKGSIDFLGLNYYTGNYVANDINPDSEKAYYKDQQVTFHSEKNGKPIGPVAGSEWLFIVPWGIYKLLKHIKDTYEDMPPIYISENGFFLITYSLSSLYLCQFKNIQCAGVDEKYDPKLTVFEVCADTTRVKFHQDHLAYILRAINEKVNVKGYFVWSYCDNFEWSEGYTVRFGLIYINFMNNLTRYPKNSAVWFTKFLRKGKRNKNSHNIKFIKN